MKKYLVLILAALLFVSCSKKEENQNPLLVYVPDNNNYFLGNIDLYNSSVLESSKKDLETLLSSDFFKALPSGFANVIKTLPDVLDGNVVVYGETIPTLRLGLKNADMLKKSLEKENIEIQKCSSYECVKKENIVAIFLEDHLVVTLESQKNIEEKFGNAYKDLSKKVNKHDFIKDNIVGFVDIESIVKQNNTWCSDFVSGITKNVPSLAWGITQYNEKEIKSKIVVPTSKDLAKKLQQLSSNTSSKISSSESILNLFLSLNIENSVKLVGELLDFVGANSKNCKDINPAILARAKTGLAFSSFMGIDKLMSLNTVISDVSKDGINGVLRVETDGESAKFFNAISSFIPGLLNYKVEDDKPVSIAYSSLFKNSPSLNIASKDNFLDIEAGNKIQTTTKSLEQKHTILDLEVNYKKYFQTILNLIPTNMKQNVDKNVLNMLPDTIGYIFYINKNGINIDASVKR